MNSKREQMKRRLQELIDNIHSEEQKDLDGNIKKVMKLLREWQMEDYEPVSFDVLIE